MTEVTTSEDHSTNSAADDLSELDVAEATSILEVKNNKGEVMRHADGRPFTIELYSIDSKHYVDLARKQADRRVAARSRQQAPILSGAIDKDNIELAVAVTKSWDIVLNGKPAPNTKEAYREAYTRLRALYEQVDQHLGTRANFSKG